MSKLGKLFKIQLIDYFHLNNWKKRSGSNRKNFFLTSLGIGLVLLLLFIYNTMTALSLVKLGQSPLIPAYMVAVSSLIVFFITLFQVNGILFFSHDSQRLVPLPISSGAILASKYLFLYTMSLVLTLLFTLPGLIVWLNDGYYCSGLFFFLILAFVPLLPLTLAAFLAYIIIMLTKNMKWKNFMNLIITLLVILSIGLWLSSSMSGGMKTSDIGLTLSKQVSRLYPLSFIFKIWKGQFNIGYLMFFVLISLGSTVLFIALVAKEKLYRQEKTGRSKPKASWWSNGYKKHSLFMSLYLRELAHYRFSYMLMLNTSLGVLVLLGYSLALLVLPPTKLEQMLGPTGMAGQMEHFAPLLVVASLSVSCTTASALSLEGEHIWQLQSLPISLREVANSKLALNLSLHALAYIPAILVLVWCYHLSVLELGLMFVIAASYSLTISTLGLYANLQHPNYHWDNEMIVIKQSLPVIQSSVLSMILIGLPLAVSWICKVSLELSLFGISVLVLPLLTLFLYRRIVKVSYLQKEY